MNSHPKPESETLAFRPKPERTLLHSKNPIGCGGGGWGDSLRSPPTPLSLLTHPDTYSGFTSAAALSDTDKVSFFHQFTPPTATAQTRRHTRGGATYLPAGTARAQALLRAVMEPHAPPAPLAGPLRVTLLWTWPGEGPAPKTTRPDLDNLAKLALDAMTWAGYWQDDSQVAELLTAKFVGPVAGLAVTVEPWQQEGDER